MARIEEAARELSGELVRDARAQERLTWMEIGKAFGSAVISAYGSREVGAAACECGPGRGHHVAANSHVIEAIGNQAPKDSPALYPAVKTGADRLIAADQKTGRTSKPGIFAGGDIVNGPATVVQAIADGKVAAESIMKFLKK